MRIAVTRSGGFTGITRKAELDTDGRADAPRLEALAREVLTRGRPAPPDGVPDGFTYSITVDDRTVYAADPGLTDTERELVQEVLREGA
ncbi:MULTISPECIES: protealysin inhibitor emfourin [Streptomycetaceae]|uniref:Metalloprotease n=1 Tax=Streptantibioticus cattleyicolor (strain ATCC 35852 / DSM 46488 / JCM 4925 / NBRC 14057 / NRRL 8057) TaxID=1003195 RepID=F8JYS0_STREN|nr:MULTISPECIES: protealysin inhibitor emfourin [Streptomycetaceae]AEW93954.1 hypothetical protein SCATT_15830 [Streptantibioticus cattleyicolor NRRL 8057 = DSM 46488]MYS58629.1 hypothetical protein [Streptomyces sp. SID5468]CCB74299.1 conserved protein of unknown function [Streptantibioticus cattleyicolor NRRL 8057 = DSM 46488]